VAECAHGSDSAPEEFDFDAVRDVVENFVDDVRVSEIGDFEVG
jgi:hypothetical protein